MHHRGSPSLSVGVDKTGGGDDGAAAFLHFGIMFPCLVCTEEFCFVLKKNSDMESLYSKSVNGMLLLAPSDSICEQLNELLFPKHFYMGWNVTLGVSLQENKAIKKIIEDCNKWTWLEELTIVGSETVASELSVAVFPRVYVFINVFGSVSDFDSSSPWII